MIIVKFGLDSAGVPLRFLMDKGTLAVGTRLCSTRAYSFLQCPRDVQQMKLHGDCPFLARSRPLRLRWKVVWRKKQGMMGAAGLYVPSAGFFGGSVI